MGFHILEFTIVDRVEDVAVGDGTRGKAVACAVDDSVLGA